jgi:hypothetical protein
VVQVHGGKSKYETAKELADLILLVIEKKDHKSLSRKEYLKTVYECIRVLDGNEPDAPKPKDF